MLRRIDWNLHSTSLNIIYISSLCQEASSKLANWPSALCHWPCFSQELITERRQTLSGSIESWTRKPLSRHGQHGITQSKLASYLLRILYALTTSYYCTAKPQSIAIYHFPACAWGSNWRHFANILGTSKLNCVINHTNRIAQFHCGPATSLPAARVLATKGNQLIEQHQMLKNS